MRRIIGAIAAPLIAVGALAGTGAVILHRAVPAELRDHLLGVGVALVIIGLLAAIAVVYRAHWGSGVLDRRAAVVLLPSFIVIGGFPLLFMAVLNMPDAVTGGLIGISISTLVPTLAPIKQVGSDPCALVTPIPTVAGSAGPG